MIYQTPLFQRLFGFLKGFVGRDGSKILICRFFKNTKKFSLEMQHFTSTFTWINRAPQILYSNFHSSKICFCFELARQPHFMLSSGLFHRLFNRSRILESVQVCWRTFSSHLFFPFIAFHAVGFVFYQWLGGLGEKNCKSCRGFSPVV